MTLTVNVIVVDDSAMTVPADCYASVIVVSFSRSI